MDIFTDVDIFKEIVEASTRGISVYILLDESKFSHFLSMTEKQGCQVQRLRVRILYFLFFRCSISVKWTAQWAMSLQMYTVYLRWGPQKGPLVLFRLRLHHLHDGFIGWFSWWWGTEAPELTLLSVIINVSVSRGQPWNNWLEWFFHSADVSCHSHFSDVWVINMKLNFHLVLLS